MKTFIASIILLISAQVFAASGFEICQTETNSHYKNECAKEVRGKYFSQEAVNVCKRINNSHYKVKCAKGAADKEYDRGELQVCGSNSNDHYKVKCVTNGGYLYQERNSCEYAELKLNRIELIAVKLQNDIRNFNVLKAAERVVDILDVIYSY